MHGPPRKVIIRYVILMHTMSSHTSLSYMLSTDILYDLLCTIYDLFIASPTPILENKLEKFPYVISNKCSKSQLQLSCVFGSIKNMQIIPSHIFW